MGLHRETLRELLHGALPWQRTLDRLWAVYGDQLPKTETGTERRLRQLLPYSGGLRNPEAGSKARAGIRGHRQSEEHIAKRLAARRASGGHERTMQALRAHKRSTRGRCISALPSRLRANPNPSKAQLREWAEETGGRLGLPRNAVLAIWKPYLERRELWSQVGRPPDERRHRLIEELRAGAQKTPKGRLKHGIWDSIALQVGKVEGTALSGGVLYQWYRRHLKSCTEGSPPI